jgi:hypothetical protein
VIGSTSSPIWDAHSTTVWIEQAFQGVAKAGSDRRIATPWAGVAASLRDYDAEFVPVPELFDAGLSNARLEDEGFWLANAGCDVLFVDGRPRKAWITPFARLAFVTRIPRTASHILLGSSVQLWRPAASAGRAPCGGQPMIRDFSRRSG